jgi:putative DNA primase/helicase
MTDPMAEGAEVQRLPSSVPYEDEALTELALARRMVDRFNGSARWSPELRVWLVWDGTKWAEDITGEVMRMAKSVVDELNTEARQNAERRDDLVRAWLRYQTAAHLRAIVDLAQTEPGVPVMIDELDPDPWVLNVENGIVDLRTGEIRAHDPSEMCTKIVPITHDPAAAAPTWTRFLEEVFDGDIELMEFVQRFAGYSLTGDVREQLLLFAHGSGANGKSTLLAMLRRLAGDYGCHIDPTILVAADHDRHPTGLTDLRGARLVTTVETEANRRLAEGLVKALTGGDPIRARRMRGDFFEFWPSHTLWLAGNHLPAIRGTDLGIWRRIALVPFDVTFTGERQDPDLPAKLAAEGPGILAWAIRGCLEWQRDGLRIPERVTAATAAYRVSNDHVGRFLEDNCIVNADAYVSAADLRRAYEAWCGEQGEKPWTAKALGAEFTNRGFDTTTTGTGNNRTRSWLGLGLAAS